jgi:hypothetical protein
MRKRALVAVVPLCNGRCGCRAFLVEWAQRLADETIVWPMEDLRGVEDMIYANLCCVVGRCTDAEFRAYARNQLSDRWWNKQKHRDGVH